MKFLNQFLLFLLCFSSFAVGSAGEGTPLVDGSTDAYARVNVDTSHLEEVDDFPEGFLARARSACCNKKKLRQCCESPSPNCRRALLCCSMLLFATPIIASACYYGSQKRYIEDLTDLCFHVKIQDCGECVGLRNTLVSQPLPGKQTNLSIERSAQADFQQICGDKASYYALRAPCSQYGYAAVPNGVRASKKWFEQQCGLKPTPKTSRAMTNRNSNRKLKQKFQQSHR